MSEEMMIIQCSPTLAGLKTGSMFCCKYESKNEVFDFIRCMNKRLVPKGLRMIPLKCENQRVVFYVYRPKKLKNDLNDHSAQQILRNHEYPLECPQKCVIKLQQRLCAAGGFPHEVGLFLGYPSEDVEGFIANNAKCAKCVGCWKVYGDEEKAKKTFAAYKKCSLIYLDIYKKRNSIDKLIVKR